MKLDIYSETNTAIENAGWSPVKRLEHFDDTCLTEDIAQFEKDNIVIDFGFYGELTQPDLGEYVILVIREQNWEKPVARISFKKKRAALGKLAELALLDFNVGFKIDYEIKILPKDYRMLQDTKGRLRFSLYHHVIFDGDILLLDFGRILHQWITNFSEEKLSLLFYASPDFADDPLLQFTPVDDGNYELLSSWGGIEDFLIPNYDLLQEGKQFIGALYREMKAKMRNVDLYNSSDFLKEYQDE